MTTTTLKRFFILAIAPAFFGGSDTAEAKRGPDLALTFLPKKGSREDLRGKVRRANRRKFRVVVYIFTDGWHNKPSVNKPKTRIFKTKRWKCDITTRPGDPSARFIVAYLLPRRYNPPRMTGQVEIPTSIDNVALDHALRQR